MTLRRNKTRPALSAVILLAALLPGMNAHALFSDDEARRAILEMRQRVENLQQAQQQRLEEAGAQSRRALLELQGQIDTLRADMARLQGENEQLARQIAELQRGQRDQEQRLHRMEPQPVEMDGQQFSADPGEQRAYEAALAQFRNNDYAAAAAAFAAFLQRWPASGYAPSARFWLGNAQYAGGNYRTALDSFRALLATAPRHARVADATLAIANCQIELKQSQAARTTLRDLIANYPDSEAAASGRERLANLR